MTTAPISITSHPSAASAVGRAWTLDHRSASVTFGRPQDRYVRSSSAASHARRPARPDFVARRLGAIVVVAASFCAAWSVADAALDIVGGSPAAAADATGPVGGASADAPPTHVAHAGDTLWSIADEYRGPVPRDRYLSALVDLNGATSIVVGQAVVLP